MTQPDEAPMTFSELDRLCDLDPLNLTVENLDKLIAGMRAYRANALSKGGKATKFSDESGLTIDVGKMAKALNPEASKVETEQMDRLRRRR